MNMITEEYRELNRKLHETRPTYGAGLATNGYYPIIEQIADDYRVLSILDYGCGKGALKKAITYFDITEYDPCIEGKDQDPEQCEMLVCLDVMEHIEPELLDKVLEHIKSKFTKCAFISVSLIPAQAILADGRNAHLIQETPEWWAEKFNENFIIKKQMGVRGNDRALIELVVLLEHK
jgi:2-polyprenyl-3-methyl-5-hydroxy-6-metoxy-1,4-benzoquinol methylase